MNLHDLARRATKTLWWWGLGCVSLALSCTGGTSVAADSLPGDTATSWMRLIVQRGKEKMLSPVSTSRLYAYVGVALYEAALPGMPGRRSLGGQLNDLPPLLRPISGARYDWPTAQGAAVLRVAQKLLGPAPSSVRALAMYHEAELRVRRSAGISADVIERSVAFGDTVGAAVATWAAADGLTAVRALPYVAPRGPSFWVPTGEASPNLAPTEPHWGELRPFALRNGETCAPPAPLAYSEERDSAFYRDALEVLATSRALTAEQRQIAQFWSDNPGQTATPPGHWMTILTARLEKRSLADVSEAYALTGIVLADSFVSCWRAKYTYDLLRPETYIRRFIDPFWSPALVTPQFPEYPSGHAVVSAAAATVLTDLLGPIPYTDPSNVDLGVAPRTFASFADAATEAATSRVLAGIHYPMSATRGLEQGRCIAQAVMDRVETRTEHPRHREVETARRSVGP